MLETGQELVRGRSVETDHWLVDKIFRYDLQIVLQRIVFSQQHIEIQSREHFMPQPIGKLVVIQKSDLAFATLQAFDDAALIALDGLENNRLGFIGKNAHELRHQIGPERMKAAQRQRLRRIFSAMANGFHSIDPRRHAIGAIGVDQRRPAPGIEDFLDFAEKDMVGADAFRGHDSAIKCHKGVGDPQGSGRCGDPFRAVEFVLELILEPPRERVGDV